jgi:hypothetical protein
MEEIKMSCTQAIEKAIELSIGAGEAVWVVCYDGGYEVYLDSLFPENLNSYEIAGYFAGEPIY